MPGQARVKSKLVFWGNLAIGSAILALMLRAYGAQALEILTLQVSPVAVAAFVVAAGSSLVCLAWRWGYILAGLSQPLGLPLLTLYRSVAHSLAVLIPSAKLAGDPLRIWLAARAGVPPAHSIASTAVDRTLEIGASVPFSILFATLLLQHGVPQLERALVTVTVASAALILGVAMALRRAAQRRGTGERVGAEPPGPTVGPSSTREWT